MIQKIEHIILSFIILTATVGITVSKHYCGNEIQKHYFTDVKNTEHLAMSSIHDNCEKNADCCHTETENIQLHNDYLKEDKLDLNTNFSFELLYIACANQTIHNNSINYFAHSSKIILPDKPKPSLSSLQTFRC